MQECQLLRAASEGGDGVGPEHARIGMRTFIVTAVARRPRSQASFVRDHRVVPRLQTSTESCRLLAAQAELSIEHGFMSPILSRDTRLGRRKRRQPKKPVGAVRAYPP